MKTGSAIGTNDVNHPALFIYFALGEESICIVRAAKAECSSRNFMILSVPLMRGNAPVVGSCSILQFLLTGQEIIIRILVDYSFN